MKFGLHKQLYAPRGVPHRQVYLDLIELAQEAERLGYAGYWTTNHHFGSDMDYQPPGISREAYEPTDYDNTFRGPVSMRIALANSLNIPAVAMLKQVGVGPMLDTARAMGITTLALIDTDCDPDQIDLPIPGNDDGLRSVEVIMRHLADAVLAGSAMGRAGKGKDKGEAAPAAEAAPDKDAE